MNIEQKNIRNVAIIAHVDHGKTTLVDAFLKQSNLFRENQEEMNQEMILDSGELEREKGITIKAKNIAVRYFHKETNQEYKINIIDTPGHSDFGGEVERTLNMADGCILLVDAQEGPMPQTKFVLKKAFELGLKPILIINKIDKAFAQPQKILDKVNDLFLNIATDDSQLEFPVFYAIGREGKAFKELPQGDLTQAESIPGDMVPIFDQIVEYVPAPTGDKTEPFQMLITSLEYDQHIGRLLIGKIKRGTVKVGDSVVVLNGDEKTSGKVKFVKVREGLNYVDVDSASAGELVAIAGLESTAIGGTLASAQKAEALPTIKISQPSVKIKFEANSSPFVGKEGKFVTAKQLQQRLEKEAETNISLKIEKADGGAYYVAGRGELQLSILIETLRREGYELQIRKPEVIFQEENGVKMEPLEEVTIDVPEEYQGIVQTALSERRGELVNMELTNQPGQAGQVKFTYNILTRNLIGLRSFLMNSTKGNAIVNNYILKYVPFTEQPEMYRKGVIISSETGTAMGYSLNTIQERGELFIEPGTQVYTGMIIGANKFEEDIEVNPIKERQKSAVRMKHDEITQTSLKAIKKITLEYALNFINNDEMIEVTPQNIRLRKVYLTKVERDWSKRKNLTDYAKQQLGIK